MTILNVLLMAPTGGDPSQGGGSGMLLFFVAMLAIMWLFMIRPQSKRAKKQREFNKGVQKGDRIVTTAGIHGRINKINEDETIQLEVSPGSYMTIERSAVSMEFTQGQQKRAEKLAAGNTGK